MTIQIPSSGKVVFGGQSRIVMRPSQTPIVATGGDILDVNINSMVYRTHTFTGIGTFEITSATDGVATIEYLAVGGGGGGGLGGQNPQGALGGGGGGGAGGLLSGTITIPVGAYTIDVGGGGATSVPGIPTKITNDALSTVLIESFGGGSATPSTGQSGGSGAGGSFSFSPPAPTRPGGTGVPGQGFPGGTGVQPLGGGGGGATESGVPGPSGGRGGAGKQVYFRQYPEFYAGGGGAGGPIGPSGGSGVGGRGGDPGSRPGQNAVIYTGSGGGGAQGPGGTAGNGSSGIVIIRYRIA